ncbi:hypothetical protein Lesp02_29950 [Lentzea sp. NBRC 105346]|uniref:hypothetical protein n=1 Tax=Lentzea sp. NBRC 105346 TaxID=3032205 RepID=UPI0024A4B0FA|nr:hypothetical protein [Lentzea sp. NBRC 105346]GLZ30806.1 hypothetical protein Lesp02_29950 [Lentzea sp. NBRC 105346]
MSKTQSQKGFGAIGVVAIILVIAVVAFAGWYVWNKSKKDDTKPTGQTAQNQDQPKPDEQKPADPTEGGKYLVISEWGVRFPLPESQRGDVKYGIETYKSDGAQAAWFEVGKIANLPDSNCKLHAAGVNSTGQSGGIGVVLSRESQPLPADEAGVYNSTVPHVGDYWYYVGRSRGSCSPTEASQQLELDAGFALLTSLTRLEAVPRQ